MSHCGRAYSIIKRVQKHFGKSLRFVFRNFPLSEIHPHAESAAETAEFAGAHGKFWEMHDLLFENQERLSGALYLELAEQLSLPPEALQQALEEGKYRLVFAPTSAVASAAASMAPRRSSSTGSVTMGPLITKPSCWRFRNRSAGTEMLPSRKADGVIARVSRRGDCTHGHQKES